MAEKVCMRCIADSSSAARARAVSCPRLDDAPVVRAARPLKPIAYLVVDPDRSRRAARERLGVAPIELPTGTAR
jgi:hypothetical protein